ncbi:uncharacterized protein V6R79_015630 [Siganus canaliculatus]
MNTIGVLSCLLLAAAVAQEPKRCTVPELLTGSYSVMGIDGFYSSQGTASYDALAQRIRFRNHGRIGNMTYSLDQLMLFSEKVYYDIDWSNFSCQKRSLDGTFNPLQVPADAKLMGQVFMGSSSGWGMGVLTNTWYGSLPGNGSYTSVFTEIGCLPSYVSEYTPQTGWTTFSMFNWVLGNTDPMDYIPPFFCAKTRLREEEEPVSVFSALKSLLKRFKTDN